MKNGWFRLWIVLSCTVVFSVITASAYYVWANEPCYTFVTVSISTNAQDEDRHLAEAMRKEATERTYCGAKQYSPILTLEDLAKRGLVTQVAVSWLEPKGWSFKDLDTFAVIEKDDIKAAVIIGQVFTNVQNARLRHSAWFVSSSIATCLVILALGLATRWVRRGFHNHDL